MEIKGLETQMFRDFDWRSAYGTCDLNLAGAAVVAKSFNPGHWPAQTIWDTALLRSVGADVR